MTPLVTFTGPTHKPGSGKWPWVPPIDFPSSFLRLLGVPETYGRTASLGAIRIDFFGGTEKRDADYWLIFRKKKLNLTEILVPQSEMGILTFVLVGLHEQMRCRSVTGCSAGSSCGIER